MMNEIKKLCALAVLTLILSCSSNVVDPQAGGGGLETTGGRITSATTGEPVPGASVMMVQVHLTSNGDTASSVYTATSNADGIYLVDSLPPGLYVLSAQNEDGSEMGVIARLRMPEDTSISINITLRQKKTLQGHLRHSGAAAPVVCLAGLNSCTQVASDGLFTFNQAPQGAYDIVFIEGSVVNYLPVYIAPDVTADTAFLRDVFFATDSSQADNIYSLYTSDLDNSFSVVPAVYRDELEPVYYAGKNLNDVGYEQVDKEEGYSEWEAVDTSKVTLILDTDMVGHNDPFGLAVLHALADRGEVEILAIMTSVVGQNYAGALDAINTYYNRPDIPIGVTGDSTVIFTSGFADSLALEFPNDISPEGNGKAVDLYRQLLSNQPDRSVSICVSGAQVNLQNLLNSPADSHSSLTGSELVASKVKFITVMGGEYPATTAFTENNFGWSPAAAINIAADWPTPIMYVGLELGDGLVTGDIFKGMDMTHPVRRAQVIRWGEDNPWSAGSHDQAAALYAVRGLNAYWSAVTTGSNAIQPDGSNSWQSAPDANQSYLVPSMPLPELVSVLESLMTALPR